VSNEK